MGCGGKEGDVGFMENLEKDRMGRFMRSCGWDSSFIFNKWV